MFCEDRNSLSKSLKLSGKAITKTTLTSEQMKMAMTKIEALEVPSKIQLQTAQRILNGLKNCAARMNGQMKCAKNTKV
jgi:hypothetical protein